MAHYAPMVYGPTALHVFLHGEDAELARIAQGASVTTLPYDATGAGFEEARRGLFFGTVRALLGYYRNVIVTDSDEFIVLDPQAGSSLGTTWTSATSPGSRCPRWASTSSTGRPTSRTASSSTVRSCRSEALVLPTAPIPSPASSAAPRRAATSIS